jgi:hypothetical protein
MQPFSLKTAEVIMIAVTAYLFCFWLFDSMQGITGMIVRSLTFIAIFITGVFYRNITPDVKPILENILKRVK